MIGIEVATADDLRWITELQSQHYGPYQAAATARLREWHGANPYGFLIIHRDGQRAGHLTLLPLRPAALQDLADGTRDEGHIAAADFYPPQERARIQDLYVESLIAEPHLLGEIVGGFDRHIARLADVDQLKTVYACPMTPSARLLMANLGFSCSGGRLYQVRFSDLVERTAILRATLNRRRVGND